MNMATALLDAGVARIPSFLPTEACASLLCELRASTVSKVGTIFDKDAEAPTVIVDHGTRRATHVTIAPESKERVRALLERLMPVLAARFGQPLTRMQDPQFISYHPGDFFAFHRDVNSTGNESPHVRERKVSVVLFLNAQNAPDADGDYEGGALQFYAHDIVPEPAYADTALSVQGEAGLLVAFEPHVRHQVTPVTSGHRVTVVTWFV